MEVIPAIDLKDGRCVRLYQGDFSKESVFSEDPVGVALRWEEQGASRLHVVDLDGAAAGAPRNLPIIKEILKAVKVPIQVGGGIRLVDTLAHFLEIGVQRVVLGTAAVEDAVFVEEVCQCYGDAIIIGVDAQDGYAATSGWTRKSDIKAMELVERMERLGARRFIYTDISRDGTLTEPNFDAVSCLLSLSSSSIIYSGGVSSIQHLVRLRELGVEGAIIGRALYTGDINLREAISAAGRCC